MGVAFLSDEWFELATTGACGAVPPSPTGPDRTVVIDSGGGDRWHLVVRGGALVAWAPGGPAGGSTPDLELVWARDEAAAWVRGERSGTAALAAIELADGSPPSPMDVSVVPALAALSPMPGATLMIQYHFGAGPFGTVDYWHSFVDGRSAGMGLGPAPQDPDTSVWVSYRKMVAERAGTITVLEALEDGGRVDGQVGPLMLLAGLHESPELRAAELAAGPSGPVLADLGAALSVPDQVRALAELARQTDQ